MLFTANEAVPYLFHRVDLQKDGELVTKLTEQEAANLCRLGFVVGRMGKRRDDVTGNKVVVLRYLELTVSMRKLKGVLARASVKTMQSKAEDSRTFTGESHKVQHDRRKCEAYFGGVTRLLPIRVLEA